MTRTYTNRADAIQREIIDPLSASEFPLTDWNIARKHDRTQQ